MANYTDGTAKIVSKDKNVIEKIKHILDNTDKEYCLCRCSGECYEEEGSPNDTFHIAYFDITSAWDSEILFNKEDEKLEDGRTITNFQTLAKKFGFGVELYSTECGCGFAEHYGVNKNGEITYWESCEYEEQYPLDEDGEPNEEEEPEIICDIQLNDFSNADEIYGEE